MKISNGERLYLKEPCLGCRPPTPGVCYDIGHIGARPSYNFIFPNGNYDGFSPIEGNMFFSKKERYVYNKARKYIFSNVIQLSSDFKSGYFDVIFSGETINTEQLKIQTEPNYGTWKDFFQVYNVNNLDGDLLGMVGKSSPSDTGWTIIQPPIERPSKGTFLNCIEEIYNKD